MKVSLCLTVHDRTPEVSKAVAESILAQTKWPDEVVIALDRPTDEAIDGMLAYRRLEPKVVTLTGPPGWRSPVPAWNAAFKAATGDLLYCISSETVQRPGNIERAVALMEENPKRAVFGKCINSTAIPLVVGAEPGLIVSSTMPRPLGFIQCLPRKAVMAIGGMDMAFADGLWYDDADFSQSLWEYGLDFIFDDAIFGTHLDHPRPVLDTDEGQNKVKKNASVLYHKRGTINPWWNIVSKHVSWKPGKTEWRHP